MINHCRRAVKDILNHRYLNSVSVVTISLAVLIAGAFILFFVNANDIVSSWQQGLRIMVYLKPGISEPALLDLRHQIQSMPQVQLFTYIPKDEALEKLKVQMRRQSALFENLRENPLPDAFEIRVAPPASSAESIESLALEIESLPPVEEVEYGQRWLGQFIHIINLFRLAGYTLAGLFFMAALFIVANTIRLILYSRREEIDIMRLVGATDGFIKAPFFIQGTLQGAAGGILGLIVLFIAYAFISSNLGPGPVLGFFQIRFLSPAVSAGVVLSSMFVGWLGCYLSLKQFLKS